jgi:adenine-specific DNA-methyltransferase
MKFLDILEETLKQDSRFVGEDGRILKTKVYDACMGMDGLLLERLINNKTLKSHFFVEVNGTLVFDKMKFAWVLESREFLPDSYTMFKNKIGLADSKGNLISQQSDVTLVWPYKDCVLEGGQTKEEQKRDEIFYNETLAPDEVNRLLYPKAFTNAKRYSKNGVEEITEIEDTDNLIIKGNNLLALASLLKRYEGKIKCIYIDPPYNTNSAANTFAYNNTFNQSSWLTFMKNRLTLSKKLLSPGGLCIVSIDHNMLFYLGVLLDEIYGKENQMGVLSVVHNPGGRQDETFFPTAHENILVYARDITTVSINNLPPSEEKLKEYKLEDNYGRYKLRNFRRSGNNSLRTDRPGLFYPIYINPETKDISLNKTKSFSIEVLPIDAKGIERCWRWEKNTLLEKKEKYIDIKVSEGKYNIFIKERESDYKGEKPKTIWDKSKYTGQTATNELKKLLGEKAFSYPKSPFLMIDILHVATNPNDIVLDFFCGSGTTAHAVLELNKRDNGNRKFILCEQMDYIENITVKRVNAVIKGHNQGSFVYCELMEQNESIVSALQAADTSEEVQAILNRVTDDGLIIPSVLPGDLRSHMDEFAQMPLEHQKKLVMELIDKNKLYVNLCDMDDEELAVSDADKAFTRSFYRMDEKGGM